MRSPLGKRRYFTKRKKEHVLVNDCKVIKDKEHNHPARKSPLQLLDGNVIKDKEDNHPERKITTIVYTDVGDKPALYRASLPNKSLKSQYKIK